MWLMECWHLIFFHFRADSFSCGFRNQFGDPECYGGVVWAGWDKGKRNRAWGDSQPQPGSGATYQRKLKWSTKQSHQGRKTFFGNNVNQRAVWSKDNSRRLVELDGIATSINFNEFLSCRCSTTPTLGSSKHVKNQLMRAIASDSVIFYIKFGFSYPTTFYKCNLS